MRGRAEINKQSRVVNYGWRFVRDVDLDSDHEAPEERYPIPPLAGMEAIASLSLSAAGRWGKNKTRQMAVP